MWKKRCKLFKEMTEKKHVKINFVDDRCLQTECLFNAIVEHTLLPK